MISMNPDFFFQLNKSCGLVSIVKIGCLHTLMRIWRWVVVACVTTFT